MDDIWVDYTSKVSGEGVRLHGLWLPAEPKAAVDLTASTPSVETSASVRSASAPLPQPPVLLYLHGARWNVTGSANRIRRMQEFGFSVLAIDYRGFGKSSKGLPSEDMAYEDAHAAWDWLARHYPDSARYIFGHSLGGAIAIDLASKVHDEKGVIVEGTFTSIADVAASMKWGWLPISPLITQRFDSLSKVAKIDAPLLVVHGAGDNLIQSSLARRLFDAAAGKKQFVLVDGGSHHSTMTVGRAKYKEALAELFSLR